MHIVAGERRQKTVPKPNKQTYRRNRTPARVAAVVLPILCAVLLLTQTAFAINTYRINDGDKVVVHTTFATDPAQILTEAGLPLGQDDTYTTQSGNGMAQITVQRRQTVTVIRGGKERTVTTYIQTVADLLDGMGIELTDREVPSVPLDSMTRDGMQISIVTMEREEISFTQVIPYQTVYCYDPTLPKGEQTVLTQGVEGQLTGLTSVLSIDGEEADRTVLTQTVQRQPVDEVIAIGTYVPREEPVFMPPDPGKNTTGRPIIGDSVIVTPDGQVLTYSSAQVFCATAYHNTDPGCDAYTATGTLARVGAIAVDPRVIPYGTRMYIVSNDGAYIYGIATAEDCGGSIKGNRIDLYFDTVPECLQFGIRDCTVYFLN